jgi:hypothetical protein
MVSAASLSKADRFARDLTVQLTGHDFLKSLGISLIPATAPDFFTEDTPTAVLVRQVLGAIHAPPGRRTVNTEPLPGALATSDLRRAR